MNKSIYDAEKIMMLRHNGLNTSFPTQGGVLALGVCTRQVATQPEPIKKKEPLPVKVRVRIDLSFRFGLVVDAVNVVVNIFALFTDRVFPCYITSDFQATVNVH